jgi:hypothetical protein
MLETNELAVQFALGGSGSGLTFHRHADAFLSLVYGVKRWFLYRPGAEVAEGVEGEGGVNGRSMTASPSEGSEGHVLYQPEGVGQWLNGTYPSLMKPGAAASRKPLECVQLPNEVMYVPAGWHHAVLNIGEAAGASWRNASRDANTF